MRSVAKFRALPAGDQWLVGKALVAVLAARLRLKLLPFQPHTGQAGLRKRARPTGASPERIAWAVERVSNRLGNATCLVRALAAHRMLAQNGFSSRIRIGVVAGESQVKGSSLVAHAWIEMSGRILVGGPDVSRYKPLLTWGN
jgi:hypothetical protein